MKPTASTKIVITFEPLGIKFHASAAIGGDGQPATNIRIASASGTELGHCIIDQTFLNYLAEVTANPKTALVNTIADTPDYSKAPERLKSIARAMRAFGPDRFGDAVTISLLDTTAPQFV